MPLETYHHQPQTYRRWRDGVRPAIPVPRPEVHESSDDWQRWKPDAPKSPSTIQDVNPAKKESFFSGSVPSVDGEKPPRWLLPLIMATLALVPGLALMRYYQLWS